MEHVKVDSAEGQNAWRNSTHLLPSKSRLSIALYLMWRVKHTYQHTYKTHKHYCKGIRKKKQLVKKIKISKIINLTKWEKLTLVSIEYMAESFNSKYFLFLVTIVSSKNK